MYKYKLNYDEEIHEIHKRAFKKVILKPALTMIGVLDIFVIVALWTLFCLSYKMSFSKFSLITIGILIVQTIVVIILYRNIVNISLNGLKDRKVEATFGEEGFEYCNSNTIKITKWSGIKLIRAFNDFLVVQDSVNGFTINIMAFKNFDGNKEDVINAIEKYIQVRRK